MMQNNLFLNRLLILTIDGKVAYDEFFHKGVNIIRGDNSSGKSTITHFIFYVLGGAFNNWVKEATKCSCVMAEVEMNGATLSLKRDLNFNPDTGKANDKEAMYIFWGSLNEILKNGNASQWSRYGFNTTENRISFSNILFKNLALPIVKGDSNITMHQILRLLYVDQESPTNSLFLYQPFDSELTRETVAELLLGVYNQELYDCKQAKVDIEKQLDEIKQEIKVIKKFAPDPMSLNPAYIKSIIGEKEDKINGIESKIIDFNENAKQVRYTAKTKMAFEKFNNDLVKQREKITNLESSIHLLQYEIEDSIFFIETISNKLKAIRNSTYTRQLLTEFPIEYCPECLSDLVPTDDPDICKLCHQPIEKGGITQARKIEQELEFQLKESKQLLSQKKSQLHSFKISYDAEKILYQQLQSKVNYALQDVKSTREEVIDGLLTEKGFLEGEILQYRTLLERAESYQLLKEQEQKLAIESEHLRERIINLIRLQEKWMDETNRAIEKEGLFLLNNDLKRQVEFSQAKEFHIDYKNNMAFISDKGAKYSASSNFYIKASARFAIFLASLNINRMRYPRFIFCDNMEDKGIEIERAQNFQRIIIKQAEEHDIDSFQIIYATSYIPDDLNDSEYCVGDYYTQDNPSLKNVN